MKNIAIIPARAGSKGLVNKNIKELCGEPLIGYTIDAAVKSKMFDTVFVSTDSNEYAEISMRFGASVPFLRNKELSTDEASTVDVILDSLTKYKNIGEEFDTFALLQPTSPLRNEENIIEAYNLFKEKRATTIVSLCEVEHSPLWTNVLPKDLSLNGFIREEGKKRRQELESYYRINGAIYISKVADFIKDKDMYKENSFAYIMDKARSIDIDTELDFIIAEALINKRNTD